MCNKRICESNTNDLLEYKLKGDIYDDNFLEDLGMMNQSFSPTLANKSSGNTSPNSSNTNVSEIEENIFLQPRINVETQKDEISLEKIEVNVKNTNEKVKTQTNLTKNTEYNLCDMIDETNNDILEFLTEMSRHEECHPDMDDLLDDTFSHNKEFYKEIENKNNKRCCCDCHMNKKTEKVIESDCNINQIRAPPGTNITIPIYAAAAGPLNPPNNIIWPPNNQVNCQNQAMYSNHRSCNRMIHPRCGMHQRPHRMLPTTCKRYPRVCHNQNNDSHSNHRPFSDTLNFQTQLEDDSCCNHRTLGEKNNVYKCFTENRQNRVGSPMNWDEIMEYLK